MTRVFFASELEGVATYWRIHRRDGVTLGFTSHDRDLRFGGVLHRAAPGMLPSALRRTADMAADSAEVHGALSHDSIDPADLAAGRFDGARVEVGAIDWATLDHAALYSGSIGRVSEEDGRFAADLLSAKAVLARDYVPRTSPTCRAEFCGPGCTLAATRFEHEAVLATIDHEGGTVSFDTPSPAALVNGRIRWIDGPQVGRTMHVAAVAGDALMLDAALDPAIAPGMRAILREGCDKLLATCAGRFANAANFQGEPFLPGNDLLARYPAGQ